MAETRWSDDPFAQRWTAGFLRPDEEGPLPWWLVDHASVYDVVRNRMVAPTHPQMQGFMDPRLMALLRGN